MRDKRTFFAKKRDALSENDRIRIIEFFRNLNSLLVLPKKTRKQINNDFENAFLILWDRKVSVSDSIRRLGLENLGAFYFEDSHQWFPLDNAAKVYPLSMKEDWMAVFRLSAYLDEPIVPSILQMALNFTIKRFPFFATTIKQGFFWHYLDSTRTRYPVMKESTLPCAPMNVSSGNARSFRVLYFQNRISVEFFHILTDGTGGMAFLKALIATYLRILFDEDMSGSEVFDINQEPSPLEFANDFEKVPHNVKKSGFVDKNALQLSGKLSKIHPCQIIHLEIDASKLKEKASNLGCTVTTLILAVMFYACRSASEDRGQKIHIQVPVNMRKFYNSVTLRNLAMYCSIRIPWNKVGSVTQLIPIISEQLKTNASNEAMTSMMASATAMVRTLRFVPMIIKKPVAKFVYGFLGDKVFTNTISNLGVVTLPPEMQKHVQKMDFVLGPGFTNRATCAMVTNGGKAVFSITKLTDYPVYEESMVMILNDLGLNPKVFGSENYEG